MAFATGLFVGMCIEDAKTVMNYSGTLAFAIIAITLSCTAIVAEAQKGPNAAITAESVIQRPSIGPVNLVLLDRNAIDSRRR